MTQIALPLTLGDRLRELAERYRAARNGDGRRQALVEAYKAVLAAGVAVDDAPQVVRRFFPVSETRG